MSPPLAALVAELLGFDPSLVMPELSRLQQQAQAAAQAAAAAAQAVTGSLGGQSEAPPA